MIYHMNKQLRIDKLFRKKNVSAPSASEPEDCQELESEIKKLENTLKERQTTLFNIKRKCLKRKMGTPENDNMPISKSEVSDVQNEKKSMMTTNLELYAMLTGMEVKSYVKDDHCSVVYHVQHKSKCAIQHTLRISLSSGNNELSKYSLPLGFNYDAIAEHYDSVMSLHFLEAIRKGLWAYYDRLEQFQALKATTVFDTQLFKVMDGSHIEITFKAVSAADREQIDVVLMLDYRVYDVRPKKYSFKEIDLSEGALELLREQCTVFKTKPLDEAFKEAFIDNNGPYMLNSTFVVEKQRARAQSEPRDQPSKEYDVTYHPDHSEYSD